jgi:hypothetical protein
MIAPPDRCTFKSKEHSDEECIGLALLHGAEFTKAEWNARRDDVRWCMYPVDGWTQFEQEWCKFAQGGKYNGFATQADIARAYCKYHNLLE